MPRSRFRTVALTLGICGLVAGCASAPPTDDAAQESAPSSSASSAAADPEPLGFAAFANDGSTSATLVVTGERGDVVWFERMERHERTFSSDSHPDVSEIHTLFRVEVENVDDAGTKLAARFDRVHGHVENKDRLEFDTAGVVPKVSGRLDDVKDDIALDGVIARVTISRDGKLHLRSVLTADGGPAPEAFARAVFSVRSILGDGVRRGAPIALGESWTGSPGLMSSVSAVAAGLRATGNRTTVKRIGTDAILLEVTGGAALAPPPEHEDPESTEHRHGAWVESEWTTTLAVSRRDGLIIRSEQQIRSAGGRSDRFTMQDRLHIVLRRVPPPIPGE